MNINKLLESNIFKSTITFNRNEIIKFPNTKDTNLYFIESGTIRLCIDIDEREQIIRLGYNNDIIVCLDSFLSEKPSPIYCQAIKKSQIRIATKKDFIEWTNQNNENKQLYINILENLNFQQLEREIDILTTVPKDRFERLFTRAPHLFQIIPDKHIANYLRMSPETLSRLKKKRQFDTDNSIIKP